MRRHSRAPRRPEGLISRVRGEGGFTLVESLMALVLVVILFVGVATSLQLAVRHQRDVRAQQQAAAIALEYIEGARSLTWNELSLSTDPGATLPNVTSGILLGSAFDLPADEAIVIDAVDGLIDPVNIGSETVNNQVFDVYQYVTDSGTDIRRYIVLVEWETLRVSHSYFTSTQISELGAG